MIQINYTQTKVEVQEKHSVEIIENSTINSTWNPELSLKKAEEIATHLLSTNQLCRNCDAYLVLKSWQYQKKAKVITNNDEEGFFIPFKNMFSMRSPESMPRARRKLNEQGLYLADDPNVISKRKQYEKAYKEYYCKQC